MFLYFWSDPWPCLGGSGLLDHFRRPYKVYDIFGMVYSPVLVSIEWIKDIHDIGHEKRYSPGETMAAKLWVTNDRYETFDGASLSWTITGPDGATPASESLDLSIPEDSSEVVGEVSWPIPGDAAGPYRMEAALTDRAGAQLSHNYFEFRVAPDA